MNPYDMDNYIDCYDGSMSHASTYIQSILPARKLPSGTIWCVHVQYSMDKNGNVKVINPEAKDTLWE